MNKYHNIPTTRKAGMTEIRFDSRKEASRYDELILMLRAGKIRNLKLQPEFTLQEGFKTPDGELVRAIRYRADFSYEKQIFSVGDDGHRIEEWQTVIEDVKSRGTKTQQYLLKRKLMQEKGITITEV